MAGVYAPSEHQNVHSDIGAIKVELSHLKEQMAEIKAVNKEQQVHLATIAAFMAEAQGGHKFLWGALAIAGSIGAFITQILNWKVLN